MGIFDIFKTRQQNTANTAKDRLLVLIKEERQSRGAPDYLPKLRNELLEVIRKYVNVDSEAVEVRTHKDGDHDVLALSIALPDKAAPATG